MRQYLIDYLKKHVHTIGGGQTGSFLKNALKDRPLMFGSDVQVGEVVDLICEAMKSPESPQEIDWGKPLITTAGEPVKMLHICTDGSRKCVINPGSLNELFDSFTSSGQSLYGKARTIKNKPEPEVWITRANLRTALDYAIRKSKEEDSPGIKSYRTAALEETLAAIDRGEKVLIENGFIATQP